MIKYVYVVVARFKCQCIFIGAVTPAVQTVRRNILPPSSGYSEDGRQCIPKYNTTI
jgi:hypothetical protein